jgi:hypothetical protein
MKTAPLTRAIAAAAIIAACSRSRDNDEPRPVTPNVNPGQPTDTTAVTTAPYDFSAELDDSRTRYTDPLTTIIYDNTGVIVSRLASGIIEMHDLWGGHDITFNPAADVSGTLPHATLNIDGTDISLDTCVLERADSRGRWYSMVKTGDTAFSTLVVTGL